VSWLSYGTKGRAETLRFSGCALERLGTLGMCWTGSLTRWRQKTSPRVAIGHDARYDVLMKMERTRIPGVYSRGSRYVCVYRDPDGIQRKKAFRTQGEAAAFKKQQEVAIHEGTYQAPSTITLHVYMAEWLPAYDQIRENTRDDYQTGLDLAKRFFSQREKLTQVTPRRIAEYVAWMSRDQKLASSSVRKRLAPISSMFRTAMEQGLVRSNPCTGVRLPRVAEQPHDEDHIDTDVKVFTVEQLNLIFMVAKEPLLWHLLACTGLRISEALALEWRHLELNGSSPHVKVRRAIVRGKTDLPKSKYGRRDVALPFSLVRQLRETERASDDLVFPSRADTPFSPNNLRKVLQPVLEEAGCAWAGFHTFRHTYASMQLSRGTNIVALSRALGHHSASFTLQVYAHLMKGDEAPALEIGDSSSISSESLHLAEIAR
jgi:site-specific recombinase XerD